MTVGVRFLGKFALPQAAQLLGIKVPPKSDSANFSDSKSLQLFQLSFDFTKFSVNFYYLYYTFLQSAFQAFLSSPRGFLNLISFCAL